MSHEVSSRLSAGRLFARILIVLLALALTVLLVAHKHLPEAQGFGLLLDSIAPWLGLGIPVLLLWALVARGRASFLILLLPVVAWAFIFGPAFVPAQTKNPVNGFTVATQNVHEVAVGQSARELQNQGADLITLQELGEGQAQEAAAVLATSHPYQYTVGTVGVFSRYPISNEQPLNLGLGWARAARLKINVNGVEVAVYAVHVASARPADHTDRDLMLRTLAEKLAQEQTSKVIAVGDFNATSTDRHFTPVAQQLREVPHAGWGLGMSWPASPVALLRIDHVMVRGLDEGSSRTERVGLSDHLAVLATVDLGTN